MKEEIQSLLFGWNENWENVVMSQFPHFLAHLNQFINNLPLPPLTISSKFSSPTASSNFLPH